MRLTCKRPSRGSWCNSPTHLRREIPGLGRRIGWTKLQSARTFRSKQVRAPGAYNRDFCIGSFRHDVALITSGRS